MEQAESPCRWRHTTRILRLEVTMVLSRPDIQIPESIHIEDEPVERYGLLGAWLAFLAAAILIVGIAWWATTL